MPRYGAPKRTLEIMIRVTHSATAVLRDERDTDGELWAASGWPPPTKKFVPSADLQLYAETRGIPAFQAYRYKDLRVHKPLDPSARALAHAWKFSPENDRALAVEITLDYSENRRGILEDRRLESLSLVPLHSDYDSLSEGSG